VVTGLPRNLAMQRNWIKDNLVPKSERWFILMDDNIHGFAVFPKWVYNQESVDRLNAKESRIASKVDRHFDYIEPLIEKDVKKAEELGVGLIGFGNNENYFFRRKKYRTITVVCQKFCIIKKDKLRWIETTNHQNDCSYSALALTRYGRVLLNNFIWPISKHLESGGLGKFETRCIERARGAAILHRDFPGLFKFTYYKPDSIYRKISTMEVAMHTEERFLKWRDQWRKSKDVR
jgi:hypothetical protein